MILSKTTIMLRYILSFFQNSEPELSIEDATAILTEDHECPEDSNGTFATGNSRHISKVRDRLFKEDYNFSTTVGKITGKREENYVIDNLYEFLSDGHNFELGESVSYQKLVSDGQIVIYNVSPIENDWDTVIQRESILTTRVMVCKVERREKRFLFLSPGDIKVDLDKVSVEFIPYIGDWLEVDVKYEVNQESIDLSGTVIEVNRISPVRPHIESGKISSWDSIEQAGSINKKVYFDKDSLSCGYVPVIGDQVVAEIIESDQNRCTWRALKVLPELMNLKLQSLGNTNSQKIEESHPGLEISECQLNFEKLGDKQLFPIHLSNKSDEVFKFLSLEMSGNSSQVDFSDAVPRPEEIIPGSSFSLKLCCTAKTMGTSNELLLFYFEGFTVGKYVNITVNPNKTGVYYQKNYSTNYNNFYKSDRQVVRGQKQFNKRFQASKLPEYPVPKKLLDLVIKYEGNKDKIDFIEELKLVKKSLFTNLNPMNYEEKFHTLLHMDEIANIICIRQYDKDRTCFIQNGEFLMVEIENLAERRPSIVLGDKIIASDPLKMSNQEYEGNVFKVGAKHVYLKFSSLFHDSYRGEDYSIRVIPGRSSYRRQHHAVYLVARNLGKDWLFPTKIIERQPQVRFIYEQYPKIFENIAQTLNDLKPSPNATSPKGVDKNASAVELIRKAREAKLMKELAKINLNGVVNDKGENPNGSSLVDQDGNKVELNDDSNRKILKLEWYNPKLNCKQKDAVINILKGVSRPLPYIIFGPPGTGKTVTVIESILQVLRLIPGSRILVTAPSNSAADLIALRLVDFGVLKPGDLVRLVSVNYAVGENIPAKLIPYCATGSMAREGTADENLLGLNGITLDCSRSVLGRHKITVSTCSSAGVLHMMGFPMGHFTHIFVDEAGQAAEPEVMIPISFLGKYTGQVILAGDPMQLGPVIVSSTASDCGLNESYLERLINRFPYVRDLQGFPDTEGFDPRLVTKLLHNYRSLQVILKLFSDLFYHGDLIPTISNTNSREARLLNSLASILPKTKHGQVPSIVFHGVEGENYQTADSPSWYNPHEAAQVFYYINELIRLGVEAGDIGVISPYTKQVREIKQLLREAEFSLPKIGTVEDFQGQEFDVILLSTVRSSRDYIACDVEHSLGFVSSPRRLNVAISRPKTLLVIIGNPALLSYDAYWRSVIKYCVENGAYTGCDFSTS